MKFLNFWTGPIPVESTRKSPILDYFYHPIKRNLSRIYVRILQKYCGLQVIAITGSFGKTTTKDLLFAMLTSKKSVRSKDNIDPVYNIPNTILRCRPNTKYLILEMGVEHLGEMEFYLHLVHPDIAIITGIGLAHTQFLHDLDQIAKEKSHIAKYARIVFINGEDHNIAVETSGKTVKVVPKQKSDSLLKSHFKVNIALATNVAIYLKTPQIQIEQSINEFATPPHRMQLIQHSSGAIIIDDSYNANPTATNASLSTFFEYAKQSHRTPVLFFGQMNELGQYEQSAHKSIGKSLKQFKLKHLHTLGQATKFTIDAAGVGSLHPDFTSLQNAFKHFLNPKYLILIKSSRSWQLDRLTTQL